MPLFIPKDRKSLFRQFLAGMYDAVVITDASGHVIETNARAEEHFGRTTDEMLDQPIGQLIRGLTPEIVQRIRKGLDEDRHVVIDANGMRKGGERFACEVAISGIELTEPDDLVFTIRNVERRRKVREMLRAKESAFEIAHAALFACDSEGRFTQANQAFLDLFDQEDLAMVKSRVFSDLLEDAPLQEAFRKALAGEASTVVIVAESEAAAEEIEVAVAPSRIGRKIIGVVGSVIKA